MSHFQKHIAAKILTADDGNDKQDGEEYQQWNYFLLIHDFLIPNHYGFYKNQHVDHKQLQSQHI